MIKFGKTGWLLATVAAALPVSGYAQDVATTQSPPQESASLGDIVVTARRREEKLQDVPASITAFSGEALASRGVQQISDLQAITPGFTFSSAGGKSNSSMSLRGIGQIPLGEATPGVVTYVNNVPLPSLGSNLPTYDVGSIQVLKGPQGTLFGRNTLGGAVLVGTQQPTYQFEGYALATYGRFNYRAIEGALNIPIIADHVALRFAGQIRRQDGRIENLSGGPDFDNIHQDAFRISLLLEPFEGFKSTTIYEYFKADERAAGVSLLRRNFSFGNLFAPQLGPVVGGLFGASLDAQTDAYLAGKSYYGAYDAGENGGVAYRSAKSITNDSSYNFGAFTIRNIFGYRETYNRQLINTGATGPLYLPTTLLGAPVDTPFTLFRAANTIDRKYITDEFQFLGEFDGFNFIVGAFYNRDEPNGPSGSRFDAFSTPATPTSSITAHVKNENYALFGQVGLDITDSLKLTAGARYSWDKADACGGFFAVGYVDYATCKTQAALGVVDGVGIVTNKGEAPSWTLGLDYKLSSDLLLYVVSRRGYRGANVNTPLFESQFTTGGTGCTFGTCPDLRPFQKTKEETLTDVEFGTKYNFSAGGARGHLNVAAYYSKYKNALQFLNTQTLGIPNTAPDQPTSGSLGVNVADLTIWGVEFEAVVSPTRNFTFSFNGAYTNQKVDKLTIPAGFNFTAADVNLPSPKFAGTMAVSWTTPIHPADGDVVLNADLFMTDDFAGQVGENLPGYKLANARIDWRNIGNSGVDLGLFVRNLTGEKYYAASVVLLPSFPTSSVVVGEQRTWGISAKVSF
ncbi:TonB-dependent receptor [Sphingobium sp. TCM1]|uniref:TonB-dependent receptor n=1 Tax=Sphingobium sp. TCM1 TaxID=453246 RepID=UPI0007F410BF|nr:TonB-dependent receptor [Sphingobium sp. TCM1]OAN56234.1 TonB-dependent receptor [Sphingobium sp. TCM1]